MATGRALTTETEREYIRGEHGDQRMYEARSRIKARINNRLAEDVDLFADEAPSLLDELRDVACADSTADIEPDREPDRPAEDIDVEQLRKGLKAAHTALDGDHPSTDMARNEIESALETIDDA